MKYAEELTAFLEVARCGSFAEAARRLNLPTTTISRKIQLLESELDVRLFNRTTRSLSLTEVGERLIPKANAVLESMIELKGEVESHAGNPVGTLIITAPPTTCQFLSPFFAEFLKKYPSIRIEFDTSSRIRDLTALRADFAFRLGPLNDSSLIALPLAQVKYLLVGNQQLIDTNSSVAHPRDYANWPCIGNQIEGRLMTWRFTVAGVPVDVDPGYTVLSDDLLLSVRMATEGTGLAYLPIHLVKESIAQGRLTSLNDQWLPAGRELYLVYTDKAHLPSKSKCFIEFIRNNKKVIEHEYSRQT